jgi:hypothetical protein
MEGGTMVNLDLACAVWRTSTHSQPDGACVQVALTPSVAGIRDSKDPGGGVLVTGFPAWDAFRLAIKRDEFQVAVPTAWIGQITDYAVGYPQVKADNQ